MHSHRALRIIAPALLVVLAAGGAHAQGQPSKAEQAVKYRKAVYQAIAWNFGPLSAMAQGDANHNAIPKQEGDKQAGEGHPADRGRPRRDRPGPDRHR